MLIYSQLQMVQIKYFFLMGVFFEAVIFFARILKVPSLLRKADNIVLTTRVLKMCDKTNIRQ